MAVEGRAMYNGGQAGLTYWAPNINVFRDPRWGRGQETPGEDPKVVSEYGVEFVRGFQEIKKKSKVLNNRFGDDDGDEKLMLSACCKHFTAYDLEKWGNFTRYDFNAVVRVRLSLWIQLQFGNFLFFFKIVLTKNRNKAFY